MVVFGGIYGDISTSFGIFLIELYTFMVFMVVFGGIYGDIYTSFGIFSLNHVHLWNL